MGGELQLVTGWISVVSSKKYEGWVENPSDRQQREQDALHTRPGSGSALHWQNDLARFPFLQAYPAGRRNEISPLPCGERTRAKPFMTKRAGGGDPTVFVEVGAPLTPLSAMRLPQSFARARSRHKALSPRERRKYIG